MHRMTYWSAIVRPFSWDTTMQGLGLERTFKDHLDQLPWNGQGHLSLDQVARSPVEPDLEHFVWWQLHHFSKKLVLVSYHPHHKKLNLYVQSKSTLFQFKTVLPCPVTPGLDTKSFPVFLISPFSFIHWVIDSGLYVWEINSGPCFQGYLCNLYFVVIAEER